MQKILPKQEMLSEKLKELKSNTDKKAKYRKRHQRRRENRRENKIKLLKINELKRNIRHLQKSKRKK